MVERFGKNLGFLTAAKSRDFRKIFPTLQTLSCLAAANGKAENFRERYT